MVIATLEKSLYGYTDKGYKPNDFILRVQEWDSGKKILVVNF